MRKVTMLAAMLAMVLVAAAPALAQSSAVGGDVQIQDQYCPQVIDQYANADNTNTNSASDDDDIGSAIAQDLGISQDAVNACLQAGNDIGGADGTDTVVVVDGNADGIDDVTGEVISGSASAGAAAGAAAGGSAGSAGGSAASASGGVLPDTGGASLIALGAGALLVAGGLLARRIVR